MIVFQQHNQVTTVNCTLVIIADLLSWLFVLEWETVMLVSLMSHYSFQNIPVCVDKQAVEIGVADKYHNIMPNFCNI